MEGLKVNLLLPPDQSCHKHEQKRNEDEPLIEKQICAVNDMNEGEMREFEVENHKMLVIKSNGEFSAIGHLCAHLGAPLVKGVLSNGKVRCPRHGACFNIKTGDIEEYPTLDGVQSYQVKIQDNNVIISACAEALETNRRTQLMLAPVSLSKRIILIIGGGPAALVCAETLRQQFFKGRIIMAIKEIHLPYDRSKLSKSPNLGIKSLLLRQPEFFSTYGIEMMTNMEVVSVNPSKKRVGFIDGTSQQYNDLLLAPGCVVFKYRPRKLYCPGADLKNIFSLSTPEEARKIDRFSKGKAIVIVGASFIGMEVAWYLMHKAKSVTVIGKRKVPFQDVLGIDIGTAIMKLKSLVSNLKSLTLQSLEAENVKFYMENTVIEFRGQNRLLGAVVLEDGVILAAQVCVVGIGVKPATTFLQNSGIRTDVMGQVIVNKSMETNVTKVFAAGDVTTFPLPLRNDEAVSIRHWQIAHSHGHVAALNMLKKKASFHSVPYFWSTMSKNSLRYAGYGAGSEEVIIHGNLDELTFVAFYIKGNNVIAACSMNSDPVVSQVAEVLSLGKTISKEEASRADMPWTKKI
ncbi:apoptosis-inducing factor 3-like [Amblyraja radiata]|uniref:apoptosis-inducing factor 3-like n=1 Tax=Amblyraja radiata TaxID=386614 RepID=UPI001403ADC2|nr:apoptosis-inducing factor 3-like [Amblyraja radiata]